MYFYWNVFTTKESERANYKRRNERFTFLYPLYIDIANMSLKCVISSMMVLVAVENIFGRFLSEFLAFFNCVESFPINIRLSVTLSISSFYGMNSGEKNSKYLLVISMLRWFAVES